MEGGIRLTAVEELFKLRAKLATAEREKEGWKKLHDAVLDENNSLRAELAELKNDRI